MFTTSNDGVHLKIKVDGPEDGDAVLLIHSLGGNLSMWDAQAAELKVQYRVIRFDARGHGGSSTPPGDYTLTRLGQDALTVMDATGAGRAHVCGLSLGGVTAQWLAIHAPHRINGLVIANTAAQIGSAETWQTRRDTVLDHGIKAIADAALGRFFCEAFRAAAPDVVEQYRQILLRTDPLGYAGCCAALRDADLRDELSRIAAPTLVIGGTMDVSTPLAEAQRLADDILDARLAVLDAAHMSNVEQPYAFTQAVLRHLETV